MDFSHPFNFDRLHHALEFMGWGFVPCSRGFNGLEGVCGEFQNDSTGHVFLQ